MTQPPKNPTPDTYITDPAIRIDLTGEIYTLPYVSSHSDLVINLLQIFREEGKAETFSTRYTEGFVDNKGNFHTRSSAGEIAYQAGQLKYDNQRQCLYSYGYNRIR